MPVIDVQTFIQVAGYVGVVLVIFADTRLLVGLLLPGDSPLPLPPVASAARFFPGEV
jgi:membrane protein DedA with SNARE-associated domain